MDGRKRPRSNSTLGGGGRGGLESGRPRTGTGLTSLSGSRANTLVGRGAGIPRKPVSRIQMSPAALKEKAARERQEEKERAWKKREGDLDARLEAMAAVYDAFNSDHAAVLDAVETMMTQHDRDMDSERAATEAVRESFEKHVSRCNRSVLECNSACENALIEMDRQKEEQVRVANLCERTEEEIVVVVEQVEAAASALEKEKERTAKEEEALREIETREELMKDAAYGLTGEAREMVATMERLVTSRTNAQKLATESEIERRELFSLNEELKGTIRVYCRVKGDAAGVSQFPPPPEQQQQCINNGALEASPAREEDNGMGDSTEQSLPCTPPSPPPSQSSRLDEFERLGSEASSTASGSHVSRRTRTVMRPASDAAAARNPLGAAPGASARFCFPDAADTKKTLELVQQRMNARSTGNQTSSEQFTFDRVYTPAASQTDVFTDVGPLVDCAIDGYSVCIFAYGQTGSGKTYTMEGDVLSPELKGITPRAIDRIFERQTALGKDGWAYTVTCSFVEIYNETIRDLLQDPNAYEAGGSACQPNHHVIKHYRDPRRGGCAAATTSTSSSSGGGGEGGGLRTIVSNVKERTVRTAAEFQKWLQMSIRHRSTAKTQLNDRSSRSHCVCTLRIDGECPAIRQQSSGILCLIDLAGSERVNDAGSHGQQFREAVNINKSLLDLGKCIYALNEGSVVPWRNSKLTFLLQHYLGSRGSKMLMVVTVSNKEEHNAESVNSLRFASRVNQTYIGAAKKTVSQLSN